MRSGFSKNIRYLSALLLVIFMIGMLASLSLLPSFALSPFDDEAYLLEDADRISLYLDASNVFETKEDKIATMSRRMVVGNYELYVDATTGEVAVRNILTGQILTTNPYDAASAPDAVKQSLMDQVSLTFSTVQDNKEASFGSFKDSALRRQITVKNIRNGVRVEYVLGRVSSKQLIPGWVEYDRFVSMIQNPAKENCYSEEEYAAYKEANPSSPLTIEALREIRYNRLIGSNYSVINPDDPNITENMRNQLLRDYPCCKKPYKDYDGDGTQDAMRIVAIVRNLSERNRNSIESAVKQYTAYTFENLQEDTDLTGYPGEDSNPAVFRLALEYTLSADGLEVRLPANSIRYNEQNYRLNSVRVLPYFGASSNDFTGYTFIPDGSGTIVRNEELIADGKNQYTISGQIYGPDFAYHEITRFYNGKSEIMRLPVFGVVEDTVMKTYNLENRTGYVWIKNELTDANGGTVYYTEEDRIMQDALDKDGKLITTVAAYLSQFKYDSTDPTAAPIKEGSSLWDSPTYTEMDTLERYNTYVEAGKAPYIEVINYYLMAEALDSDGKVLTYKGNPVYVYVDEEGNVVEENERVEGVLKITEQLWYNGQPAYYNSDVPMDPSQLKPDTPVTPPEGGEEDPTQPDPEEPNPGEGTTEEGGDPTTPPADETTEETVEIKYYNNIPKTEEKYDEVAYEEVETVVPQGYFAIVTEGEALCTITSRHGGMDPANPTGGEHKYNSVYISAYPRPQDSYRLADAISVSNDSAVWTVVSERKYTGDYRIKYIMISDATYVETNDKGENQIKSYPYRASYVGMADVYREYLIKKGDLKPLTQVDDDIPLYLEALGKLWDTKVVATIPVTVDVPLTTFEDLQAIYKKLSEEDGIDHVNFKLTGFTKGGMFPYAANNAKFESVVGGNGDYEDMVNYCKEISSQSGKHLAIYPDFDFANVETVGAFDGFSALDDSSRTIDDRYASKRTYNITYQNFDYDFSIMVSPSVFMRLYEKFSKKIDKLGVSGIAVSTLGSELSSDFDSDDPYNREDSKRFTTELLSAMSEKYGKVMIDSGNAYALPYADHILNMPLDSSRYARAGASVPFMGMVLHGYVNYAGAPTGMASDIDRELLKIIENGAAPFFTVVYQNSSLLKDFTGLDKYYSVDFDICYDEIVEKYKILNEALADIQTATITDHRFLTGIRSLGANEQKTVNLMMEEGKQNFEQAVLDAHKAYNNRKALAERHGEEFTEVFEETYAYLATAETYAQHILEEFTESLDREINNSTIVMVEYTRKDGTTKSFILNYEPYEVTVVWNNVEYLIPVGGFATVGQ